MTIEELQAQLSILNKVDDYFLDVTRHSLPVGSPKWREVLDERDKIIQQSFDIQHQIAQYHREQLKQKCLAGEPIIIAPTDYGWTSEDCYSVSSLWDLLEMLLDQGELWLNGEGTPYFVDHYD